MKTPVRFILLATLLLLATWPVRAAQYHVTVSPLSGGQFFRAQYR